MARTLPKLTGEQIAAINSATKHARKLSRRERKKLDVLRMVAGAPKGVTAKGLALSAQVSRATVFNYLKAFTRGGIEELLKNRHGGGRPKKIAAKV